MKQYKAHDFPQVYEDLGVDLRDLGCMMLSTSSPVESFPTDVKTYVSPDPKKFWIQGLLDHWHVTLRYGFLPGLRKSHVDAILDAAQVPSELSISGLEVFASPYPEEKYGCLVARVEDERLIELNQALSLLPNVNTFSGYKAHITIGYFEQSWLNDNLDNIVLKDSVKTKELDYGHNIK